MPAPPPSSSDAQPTLPAPGDAQTSELDRAQTVRFAVRRNNQRNEALSELPTIPTDREIANEPDEVRRAVLSAMQRILTGNPRTVRPGSDSVLQLAVEAGVGRHQLYRRDPDLRLRFERLKNQAGQRSDAETRWQTRLDDAHAEVTRLTKLQAKTRKDAEDWKGFAELLQRALNVLQEELRNEQIRNSRLTKRLKRMEEASPLAPVVPIRPRDRD